MSYVPNVHSDVRENISFADNQGGAIWNSGIVEENPWTVCLFQLLLRRFSLSLHFSPHALRYASVVARGDERSECKQGHGALYSKIEAMAAIICSVLVMAYWFWFGNFRFDINRRWHPYLYFFLLFLAFALGGYGGYRLANAAYVSEETVDCFQQSVD